MPRVKLSIELKKAIENINDKDKNKLIFRLLPSNAVLVETLEFQLLEQAETTEHRRDDLRKDIQRMLNKFPESYNTPWVLVKEIRRMSSLITRHVKVTKDKLGEIDLHFYLLNGIIRSNYKALFNENHYVMEKLAKYTVLRAKRINTLLSKIHEDYLLEFETDMKELGNFIQNINSLEVEAANQGFDVSYFMKGELNY